jgi:hypothetical protein
MQTSTPGFLFPRINLNPLKNTPFLPMSKEKRRIAFYAATFLLSEACERNVLNAGVIEDIE